jgi:hypothetical protein
MTIPYVGRCLGSGELPREESVQAAEGQETGVCVACSGRFEIRDGKIVEHETAQDDEREALSQPTPPSRTAEQRGPTSEEELRGAQPPNHDPEGNTVVDREPRVTGQTADVVDLDQVSATGSSRSAHRS